LKSHLNIKAKVLALFLVIALAFTQIVPVFALNAETDPMIIVSDATGAPGGTASVTIDLKNNPGIVSMTLYMSYNDEILTLTEVNDAGVLGSTSHKPELVDPYTLVWVNDTATTNYTVNGTIVTLVFTVSSTAEKGTIVPIDITYDYDNYDVYDKDANKIKFEIDNGSVTVGDPGPNAIDDFTYTTSGTEITITGYQGTATDVIIGDKYEVDGVEYTVTEIAMEAFLGQEEITSVIIPETVDTIGEAAFYDCIALTEVTVLNPEAEIGEVAFGYYYAGRKEHIVEGFTINGYAGSTAAAYAETDAEITFKTITAECSHSGGEATCKNAAICEKCGESYGSLNANNHKNTEVRNATTATCNTAGYTGDTWCTDCETKIATGTTIDATGDHADADNKWESNDTQHFHTCACGTKFDYTDHTGGEATCKDKAVCTACGASYGELNANNHKGTTYLVGQKEATCYEEGYTGDTYCSDCDVKIATGTTIKTNDHNPASVWSTDDTHHWKECDTIGCGNLIDKAEHTGGEATCTTKAVCSVCKVAYGTVNANNHKNTEIRDAVAATCNTTGYTGDTWCTDCETKIATGTTIDATGAHVDVDGKWESNDTQHFHTCACSTKFDFTDHTGGEATCKDKAVCTACGASYGELNANNHKNTEIRNATAATCNTAGYTGDTWCTDCETKIATGTTIDATGDHVDADNKWESNDTQHFHTCACGTKFDYTDHTGGEATCKNKAVCTACGTSYGELNANNHKGTTYLVGQKEATCYEEGYTGDTYCADCDVKIATGTSIPTSEHNPASIWSTDDTHHWKVCSVVACGNIIDKAEHTGGEATCTAKAVCSVCQVAYGSVNDKNHKNTEVRDAVAATCVTVGYTGDTWCKDCNTKIADGSTIPAGHKTVKVPAVEATHYEDGNIEYFTCSGCEKLFTGEDAATEITLTDTVIAKGEHSYSDTYLSDADNHWKACACGNIIEKTAHTFGEWSTTKESTTTEKGSKEKVCTVCGYKIVEEIPVVDSENDGDTTNNSPQTGDNSNLLLWIVLLFVSGSCLIVFILFNKKSMKQNR